MDQLFACEKCAELHDKFSATYQFMLITEKDQLPEHEFIFKCTNGEIYRLIQKELSIASQLIPPQAIRPIRSHSFTYLRSSRTQQAVQSSTKGLKKDDSTKSASTQSLNSFKKLPENAKTPSKKYGIAASLSKLQTSEKRRALIMKKSPPPQVIFKN
ncbi:hypothetical protein O3M35_011936 [Rhynocoris fuscipes]|uniref:Uncharacterized protein n=1 Tax=Rhynocoris fuscipes TaxID=488301 RepID=A0AAW1D4S0_9HEMI